MHRTVVINIVGLSQSLIGEHTPNVRSHANTHGLHVLQPVLPAVTCSVQSSMLTGLPVRDHGIVGNGWFNRELNEVQFWKQSNALVHGDKAWDIMKRRNSNFTCANMFWWFNMYSTADYCITPRPIYKADGRKIADVHSNPPHLREELQAELGRFPLFKFWGPGASIESSRWIAHASMRVWKKHQPTLMLIYLPHLDYALQKLGPAHADIAANLREIDLLVGELMRFLESQSYPRVILLSEYGIEPVSTPIDINRLLRRAQLLSVREEDGLELLDAGASRAFAVADHQIAHVYVKSPVDIPLAREICQSDHNIELILDRMQQRQFGIDHERAGDLVLVTQPGAWFNYQYWLDDRAAPDFARTVDIHRKPGYDPLELFIDPGIGLPSLKLARKLVLKKLGFRTLMDVVPLDASLVRGSHGRTSNPPALQPVIIGPGIMPSHGHGPIDSASVGDIIMQTVFG